MFFGSISDYLLELQGQLFGLKGQLFGASGTHLCYKLNTFLYEV